MSVELFAIPSTINNNDILTHFKGIGNCKVDTSNHGRTLVRFRDAMFAVGLKDSESVIIKDEKVTCRLVTDDLTLGDLTLKAIERLGDRWENVLDHIHLKYIPFILEDSDSPIDNAFRNDDESIGSYMLRIDNLVQRLDLHEGLERALKFEVRFYDMDNVLKMMEGLKDTKDIVSNIIEGPLGIWFMPTRGAVVKSEYTLEHIKEIFRETSETLSLGSEKLDLMMKASVESVFRCMMGQENFDLLEENDFQERPEFQSITQVEKNIDDFISIHCQSETAHLNMKLAEAFRTRINFELVARIVDPDYDWLQLIKVPGLPNEIPVGSKEIMCRIRHLLRDKELDDDTYFGFAPHTEGDIYNNLTYNPPPPATKKGDGSKGEKGKGKGKKGKGKDKSGKDPPQPPNGPSTTGAAPAKAAAASAAALLGALMGGGLTVPSKPQQPPPPPNITEHNPLASTFPQDDGWAPSHSSGKGSKDEKGKRGKGKNKTDGTKGSEGKKGSKDDSGKKGSKDDTTSTNNNSGKKGSKGKNSKGKGNDTHERWDDNDNGGKGRNNNDWWDNNKSTGKDETSKKGKGGKFYEENYTKGKNAWDNDNNVTRGKGKKRDNHESNDGSQKRSQMDGLVDGLSEEQRAMAEAFIANLRRT